MAKQIFQERAMERLSSPGRLDQLMVVTSPRGWIALAGAAVLLAIAILWGIRGTLQNAVEASGVLTRPGGVVTVRAAVAGEVEKVLVRDGDRVTSGQPLVRLWSAESGPGTAPLAVASPMAGRVIDLPVRRGDQVADREPLATVEALDSPLLAVVYLSASEGYRVQVGKSVQISVGSTKPRESQPLRGRVQSVGRLPATPAAMMRILQSEAWVSSLTQYGPVLEVVVRFDDEEQAKPFYSGTPCQARIVVEEKRPIELILGSVAR